jgi:hypothetical protein
MQKQPTASRCGIAFRTRSVIWVFERMPTICTSRSISISWSSPGDPAPLYSIEFARAKIVFRRSVNIFQ